MSSLVQNGLVVGSIYGVIALGLVLVYRNSRVLNFAHGEAGMIGAFVFVSLSADRDWHYLISAVMGVLVAAVAGVVTYFAVVRLFGDPVRTMIGTLGIAGLLQYVAVRAWGLNPRFVSPPLSDTKVSFLGLDFGGPRLLVLVVGSIVAAAMFIFFRYSRWSRVFQAVAEDPYAAELMGISIRVVGMVTWAVAGALAGIAAILIAPLVNFYVLFMTVLLVRALAAALLAGLVNVALALPAGLAIGCVEAWLTRVTTVAGATEAVMVVFIVALVALRPAGQLVATRG